MQVSFTAPVTYSSATMSFTGVGIPSIPDNAEKRVVGRHTVVFISPTGECWEKFDGRGTTENSQTVYWVHITQCPRAWAKE
jgi:hypothetical protein